MKKNPKSGKIKKIPMRTCCGCRETFPKSELIRIVRTPEGEVKVDFTGKLNGRGSYLCVKSECLAKAKKNGCLARTLEVPVTQDIYRHLEEAFKDNET